MRAAPSQAKTRVAKAQEAAFLTPMLALPSELPRNPQHYGFEFKWEGIRAIVHVERGRVRAQSRSLRDITSEYPEVLGLAEACGRDAVLDGELVAFNDEGRPDFGQIQQRMGLTVARDVERRMREVPVAYFAFDLLRLDREWLLTAPYWRRRHKLESLGLSGPSWQTPAYTAAEGEAVLEASRKAKLEGIVAKRLESRYRPGERAADWLKIKNRMRQEFVVGGWTEGEGARAHAIGALLVGYYEGGRFVYAGRVGTGFTAPTLKETQRRLAPLERKARPFDGPVDVPRPRYVDPRVVVEVEFAEWTHADRLRQASFKGFRDDKDARDVVREDAKDHG